MSSVMNPSVEQKISLPGLRLRRLRKHPALRRLINETVISTDDLVLPLFIKSGEGIKCPIESMPGQYQLSVDQLPNEIKVISELNIPAVILFGIPDEKDEKGLSSLNDNGVIQQAVRQIKQLAPEMLVITDLCFCEYTNHGHCGVLTGSTVSGFDVDNDRTLKLLVKQAESYARAGADVIAPSGMMDGMVGALRDGLNQAGYTNIPILSYAVKYASSFYGPFREAAEGAPQFGDRKTYQMNPANGAMALREAELDVKEGADMLMVKPGMAYLDIIYRVKQQFPSVPLGAYQVSGEYSMIKAAAEKGWIDEQEAMMESLVAIKRAGADFIITYFAKKAANWIRRKDNI
jgi:porphobilinogen synthase